METNLQGRLRNTPLPASHSLMPLFEAVVNAIHSVDEANPHDAGTSEHFRQDRACSTVACVGRELGIQRLAPLSTIEWFIVTDNGLGFTDQNLRPFETLDSDFKARLECRGVGRLLWLKAFEQAEIASTYMGADGELRIRRFSFGPPNGTYDLTDALSSAAEATSTSVRLDGFRKWYTDRAPR